MGDRFALALNCCKRAETPAQIIQNIPVMLSFVEEFDKPH